MLDEYVENELAQKSAAQVSRHIAVCSACAGEYEIMRRESQTYSLYLQGIEATPAIWTNVQAEVEKVQSERFSFSNLPKLFAKSFGKTAFNPALAAAALVLLMTLGIVVSVMKYKSTVNTFDGKIVSHKTDAQILEEKMGKKPENEIARDDKKPDFILFDDKTSIARAANRVKKTVRRSALPKPKNQFDNFKPINPGRQPTTEDIVEKAERQYKNAIVVLSGDIKRQRAELSQNLISQLEQSLTELDRTINETRRAVRAQPNDAAAVQYMTTAYAKKIELLRTVAGN